jgi:hypothetical protein
LKSLSLSFLSLDGAQIVITIFFLSFMLSVVSIRAIDHPGPVFSSLLIGLAGGFKHSSDTFQFYATQKP